MKKHILSSVAKKAKLLLNKETFYDFKMQLSFMDKDRKVPVLNASKEGTKVETSTIENSDPDEFTLMGPKTSLTETIENSDVDEFSLNFSGTKQTRAIEDSDIDSIIAVSSRITKSLEDSDADGFVAPPTTKTTFTVETSDPDEFAFN